MWAGLSQWIRATTNHVTRLRAGGCGEHCRSRDQRHARRLGVRFRRGAGLERHLLAASVMFTAERADERYRWSRDLPAQAMWLLVPQL